jgi:anti-sigma regulatory factor (Ser/Thr protein kinase)
VTGAIKLKIPHQPPYHGVALLVVGGLAARLDVSYEQLEDLQLALESVLENSGYARTSEVTVELDMQDHSLAMIIGPLDGAALRSDLEDRRDDRLALGRLLGTLVEDVTVEGRDDGDWLRLQKRVVAVGSGGSRASA